MDCIIHRVTKSQTRLSMHAHVYIHTHVCMCVYMPSQVALMVRNPASSAGDIEMQVRSLGWDDPLEKGGHGNPLQYSCLENPYRQSSLVAYSPWGHKESDMTE